MRRAFLLSALLVGLFARSATIAPAADVVSQSPPSSASSAAQPTQSPEALVHAALEASLAGDVARRDELLRQALAADPYCAPARWISGQLKFGGRWRTLEEVEGHVSTDHRWAKYDELRQSTPDSPEGHLDLARWCMREGLDNEEQIHWRRVLRADPRHELARARLGLQEYNGQLYTKAQIAAHEKRLAEDHRNFAHFAPVVADICERAASGSTDERDRALLELRQIEDPRAIQALEVQVAAAAREAGPELAHDLANSMVVALSNMSDPAATERLLYYSVMADDAEVRQRAAEALAPRPVTDYVPHLMAALQAPVQAVFLSTPTSDGGAAFAAYMYQQGPLADFTARHVVSANAYTAAGIGNAKAPGPRARALRQQFRHNAELMENVARQRVAMTNLEISVRNARIREALFNALDVDFGPDPKTYWQEWTSYNELYIPERPVISLADGAESYYVPTMSCFALGTPVWTQAGPVPIERIAAGDLVLSQHPETGELAFREVLERTVRPPAAMARVSTGHGSVEATLGHRFWINGQGWEMTKFLKPGHSLHTLDGPADLAALEPLKPNEITEAYNLVVDDFHTYVVGDARLVVHDNTCPRPVTAKTLGLPERIAHRSTE